MDFVDQGVVYPDPDTDVYGEAGLSAGGDGGELAGVDDRGDVVGGDAFNRGLTLQNWVLGVSDNAADAGCGVEQG